MKLYPIPGGTWAATEADWKAGMKAAGLNPKDFENTKFRDVPTGKKELMEFLTFFAVDPYRLPGGATTVSSAPAVDVEALRRQHNPDAPDLAPTAVVDVGAAVVAADAPIPDDRAPPLTSNSKLLAELFTEAPIKVQAELAVGFIDRLTR